MIVARIEANQPVLVPPDLLAALGLGPGDEIAMERVGDHIVIAAVGTAGDPFTGHLAAFSEWGSDEDRQAFDGG